MNSHITICQFLSLLSLTRTIRSPNYVSLALAVGMAPELLPAIMTVAMSSVAATMMKKKVIVKKLLSILNFGEVRILCSDKTGTITEGTVIANDFVDVYGNPDDQVRLFAF
ncbi:hypothetical protein L0660_11755 [Dyadobacter sp. CY351]|nr:hypothetical protein [Dyadobacter sp. CY351]MCF2518332.1 hypothetical protein [Dyadobacter sp. CY351]